MKKSLDESNLAIFARLNSGERHEVLVDGGGRVTLRRLHASGRVAERKRLSADEALDALFRILHGQFGADPVSYWHTGPAMQRFEQSVRREALTPRV